MIQLLWLGSFTNITRVRLVRDRQELTTYAAAFTASAFDPEKAIYLGTGFMTTFQFLCTTGAGPSITVYFTYDDFAASRGGRGRGR